jgi:hypothetical protein
MAAAAVIAVGCGGESGVDTPLDEQGAAMSRAEQDETHAAWLVDMIVTSDMSNELLAEYSYDEQNRLVKINTKNRNKGNRIIDTRDESRLEWRNGMMVRQFSYSRYIDVNFGYDHENTTEIGYDYDDEGRLVRNGGSWDYLYDDEGRLVQTYSYEFEGMTYRDLLEWDDNDNVTRHICARPESDMIGEPIPGSYHEQIFEYEYDNHPKPNFGLGKAFFWDGRLNTWPGSGTTDEQMARALSRNNLTLCEQTGHAYRYTYNENGLPETVQTIWIGIETLEPMIQTVLYKGVY